MVVWRLQFNKSIIKFSPGQIITATPCDLSAQSELLTDMQYDKPRFSIYKDEEEQYGENIPKIIAKHLLHLDGSELKEHFTWWCNSLGVRLDQADAWGKLIPTDTGQWYDLDIEKKVALYAGAAIKASQFTFIFLGELHLENNSQIFLFNFLKNMTRESSHQLMLLWSYRTQIPQAVPLYFKGFEKNAA